MNKIAQLSHKLSVGAPYHYKQYRLGSAFQPIFSLSYRQLVGYEALVRGRDAGGGTVSPAQLFAAADTPEGKLMLDQQCQQAHIENFARDAPENRWLFLNIDTATLNRQQYRDDYIAGVMACAGLGFHRLVIEVLENEATDLACLLDAVTHFRSLGALVALDDFGAGHSNFDRIWRLAPDIVKLDRSLIAEAARHTTGSLRRVLPNLVALVHEAGSLVLVEGVETDAQALIALDAEADFIQGFALARPDETMADGAAGQVKLNQLTRRFVQSARDTTQQKHSALAPYVRAFRAVSGKFHAGPELAHACQPLLAMPNVIKCLLLDERGEQLGEWLSPMHQVKPDKRFAPVTGAAGGIWFSRQYFRDAFDDPQRVQISRPYLSSTDGVMCTVITVSSTASPRRVFCCRSRIIPSDALAADPNAMKASPDNARVSHAGHAPGERYAETDTETGRVQRFWLGQLHAAGAGYVGAGTMILLYALLTWRQAGRGWMLLVVAVALGNALAFHHFQHRVMASRYRLQFFAGCNISAFVMVAVLCGLDGGIASPITYLFILPMLYLALGFPSRAAICCGAFGLASYGALIAFSAGPRPYLFMLLELVTLGLGYMLAIIGAFTRDRKDQELTRLRQQLEVTAATDELTGCLNQRCFNQSLAREVVHAARYRRQLAVLLIDIDYFKAVNDEHGHMTGDDVLRHLGKILRETARRSDICGRPGGDELAVIAPETDYSAAITVAERLRVRAASLVLPVRITLSVGVCSMVPCSDQPTRIFRRADQALYKAKGRGRDQIAVCNDDDKADPDHTKPAVQAI